ncbi:aspartate-semialdehyde dehydrogenase [bacterium]|nr:aspartate-semialdehyde dehydrogenase [bacterium]
MNKVIPKTFKKPLSIAIVNPGDIITKELITIIEESDLDVNLIDFISPKGTEGKILQYNDENRIVTSIFQDSFVGIDLAFFILSKQDAENLLPLTLLSKTFVIDVLGSLIHTDNIPLALPEINSHVLTNTKNRIICVPTSISIQLSMILFPIQQQFGLKRVIVSTYQSVSGKGEHYINQLAKQTISLLNFEGLDQCDENQKLAFNCLPESEDIEQDGYSKQESDIEFQVKSLLDQDNLNITVNSITIPVFHCDCLSVNIETLQKIPKDHLKNLYHNSAGIKSVNDDKSPLYPTPMLAANQNMILVGKIREDKTVDNGINLWCVMDNLRKGSAHTAVKIAEELTHMNCF